MRYDYTDIDTFESLPDPEEGTYSIIELNHEHRVRYVMRTEKGSIILRHMPLRLRHILDNVLYSQMPKLQELSARARDLAEGMIGVDPKDIPQESLEELERIQWELAIRNVDALGVIVSPPLADMDDFEELYAMLSPVDRARLISAVIKLSAPVPLNHIDDTALIIAKSLNLDILDPSMPEMLTVSQAQYYNNRIARENAAIERMLGQSTKKVG